MYKKVIYYTIFFVVISVNQLFAQEEKFRELLEKPEKISDCELFSQKVNKNIFLYYQNDSISEILKLWKNQCGITEPYLRLKILHNLDREIQSDTLIMSYMNKYYTVLEDRILDSKEEHYKDIYKNYKEYYAYIPLKSNFDSLTVKMAKQIKENKSLTPDEELICILFSFKPEEYENSLHNKKYKDALIVKKNKAQEYKTEQKDYFYSIILGTWIPVNEPNDIFNISPQAGIFVGGKFKKFVFDIGLALRVNINDNDFEIIADSGIVQTDSDIGFYIGASGGYTLYSKKKWNLISKLGIGYDIINTDVLKENTDSEEDEYYSIGTVNLNVGISILREIVNYDGVGMEINYHYVPYHLDKDLYTSFGTDYITLNLIYQF